MAKVYFIGTCSGTEPMPGMHHCALAFEIGGAYYWFDAGEDCSYRAYLAGIDLMKVRTVFISHPHIDHVGGLANLLSRTNKICSRYKRKLENDNTLHIFMPDMNLLEAVKTVAASGRVPAKFLYTLAEHEVTDGLLWDDGNLRVTALHNRHLNEDGSNGWHSYSYLLEFEGKRVVFSGDVRTPDELDPFVTGGVDMLIMETGHHAVADVCAYAESRGVPKLRFNHHGREIIGGRELAARTAARYNCGAKICRDGMVEEI